MKTRLIALCIMFFCFMCVTPVVAESGTQLNQEENQITYNDLPLVAEVFVLVLKPTFQLGSVDIRMPSKWKILSMGNFALCRKNHLRNYHYRSEGGRSPISYKKIIIVYNSGAAEKSLQESFGGALPTKG